MGPIKEEVHDWQRKLMLFQETLDEWAQWYIVSKNNFHIF